MTRVAHLTPGAQLPARMDCGTTARESTAVSSTRALDTAYRRERHVLLGFLARRVGADAAADLVQEVFTRAARAGNFAEVVNQRAWLLQIARNLLINRWRTQRRANVDVAPFEEERMMIVQPDPFWWIDAADLVAAFERATRTMSPKTREVFLMHRVDQLSYREISAELGLGIKGVEHRMRRALVACRRALIAFGCDG